MRDLARRSRLVALALLLARTAVHALSEGPPGATTGDRGTPFAGLALSPEAQLATGAATASLPLDVPPGRGGMTPNLRLVYSSHGGVGALGTGWDLPIGRIERSTRLGVPSYAPEGPFVVSLPDGTRELVDEGWLFWGLRSFAARIDDAHASITADVLANTWTLHDRSGRDYTFGASAESRLGPAPSSFGGTFSWHLTRVRDPNGNTIDVTYLQAPGGRSAYPSDVLYGGNTNGLAHTYAVHFTWVPNPGTNRLSYAAGFAQDIAWVLSRADVRYLGDAANPIVRWYELRHRASATSGSPLLAEILLHGSDGSVETYHGTAGPEPASMKLGYHETADAALSAEAALEDLHVDSFRNDGDCNNRDFVDLNGDGRPDLVRIGGWSTDSRYWTVYLNRGRGAPGGMFAAAAAWYAPRRCLAARVPDENLTTQAIVDMDGDGLPDYVDSSSAPWQVWLNTGFGFSTTPVTWRSDGVAYLRAGDNQTGAIHRDLVDLNGDGRPDLVGTVGWSPSNLRWNVRWNAGCWNGAGGLECGFSDNATVFAPHATIRDGGPDTPDRSIRSDLFDVNGDALPDKVVAKGNDDGGGPHWNVWYGTGNGFVGRDAEHRPFRWPSPPPAMLRQWNGAVGEYEFDVLDVNGDGLPDFVDARDWARNGHLWEVWLNTGTGLPARTLMAAPERLRRKSFDGSLFMDVFDADGNGYPDIVKLPGTNVTLAQIFFGHPVNVRPDTLALVADAAGAATLVEYDVTTALGGANTANVDPVLWDGRSHLPFPVHVVSAITRLEPAGAGSTAISHAYVYDGGYWDGARREFRGFRSAARIEVFRGPPDVHGMTEWAEFRQTDGLAGRVWWQATYARYPVEPSGILKQTLSTWSCAATPHCTTPDLGGRYLPVLTTVERFDHAGGSEAPWVSAGSYRASRSDYAYDACGNVTREVAADLVHATTVVSWAAYEQIAGGCNTRRLCTGICDRAGSLGVEGGVAKALRYDGRGNLIESKLQGEGDPTTTLGYDGFGNLTSTQSPRGLTTTIEYDPETRSRPAAVTQHAGGRTYTTRRTYDPKFGTERTVTDVAGATTSYTYDAFGRVTSVIEPGASPVLPTRRLAYVLGPVARVDTLVLEPKPTPHYLPSAAFFDAFGRPLQTQATRRVHGVRRTVVTGARRYGQNGRLLVEHAPVVLGSGEPTTRAVIDDPSRATFFVHDEFGRVIRRVNPDLTITTTSYATPWQVRRCDARHAEDPSAGQCVEEERDAFDRLLLRRTYLATATTPHTVEERTYHAPGWLRTLRTGSQSILPITTTYDALGRKTTVTDPDTGGVWRYGYDLDGNVVYVDDPQPGQHLEMRYDLLGRLTQRLAFTADAPGAGVATVLETYTYDSATGGLGRLARVDEASGFTTFEAYDPRGNVLRTTKSITFQPPGGSRTTRQFTNASAYDAVSGRLESTTVPYPGGSETLYYDYSPEGTPQGLRSDHGIYVRDLQHDEMGRVATATYGNAVQDVFFYETPRDGYRLHEILTGKLGAQATPPGPDALHRDVLYQDYDANGNVRAIRDLLRPPRLPTSATLYAEYDDASRLARAIQCGGTRDLPAGRRGYDAAFTVDGLGNLTRKDGLAYPYAAAVHPHRPLAAGPDAVAYDANGSMTGLPGNRSLTWDALGRLTEVRRDGAVVGRYQYDYRGERVAAYTEAEGTTFFFGAFDARQDGTVVRHLSFGGLLVASSPVSTTLQTASVAPPLMVARGIGGFVTLALLATALAVPGRRRVRPLGRVRRGAAALVAGLFYAAELPSLPPALAQCDPTGGVLPAGTIFYHVDHLGSPRLLTDVHGDVVEHLVHRPYGFEAGVYDAGGLALARSQSPFQFTGQRGDDGTGLLYFGARYYDPALGLFVSHDPAREFLSPYSYLDGDPLNGTDPSGACGPLCIFGLVLLFLGAAAAGIQAGLNGASPAQATIIALKNLGVGLGTLAAGGVAVGIVGNAGRLGYTAATVAKVAVAGYGLASTIRGAVESFQSGQYALGSYAILSAAAMLGELGSAFIGGNGRARGGGSPGGDRPPRPLTDAEQAFLDRTIGKGVDWSEVKVDEGFWGEYFASGQVRSDREINVSSGFSRMPADEQLALLTHEAAHIWQRRAGTLDNIRGFFTHLGARLTGRNLYGFPDSFSGGFSSLNFEQQAVVIENAARLELGQPPGWFLDGRNLGADTVRRLYREFRNGP